MNGPTYFETLDTRRLFAEYPTGPRFVDTYRDMSSDRLRAVQEERFARVMRRGWQTAFYRRRWSQAGIEPGDIRSLDDLPLLPIYDKSDVMESIDAHPPLGDLTGLESYEPENRPQIIVHTTSGTTGTPQPLVFGPWGREVSNLVVGRMFRWLGVGSDDVVHSVYGHGLINGGHYLREAVTHHTNALFLSAGTGAETRSVQQVEVMRRFGATVVIGFVDYIRKLAETASELGLQPGVDIPIRMIIGHLAADARQSVEQAWGGAPAFDWYGVADTGCVAGEGPERNGLYVWEDAHFLEIIDPDRGGEATGSGDMVVTCLYKDDVAPVIRFNTHDVSSWKPGRGELVFRRINGFLGRSDNMVKIRGINVYPHAVAGIIAAFDDLTGEFVCRVARDPSGRDDLTVILERRGDPSQAAVGSYRQVLSDRLGIAVEVEVVPAGATAAITQVNSRQKPIRLIDERA